MNVSDYKNTQFLINGVFMSAVAYIWQLGDKIFDKLTKKYS